MTYEKANAWGQTESREFDRTAFPWRVAGGGTEIPMMLGKTREWAIYCFNNNTEKYGYYLFGKDIFVSDDYFDKP